MKKLLPLIVVMVTLLLNISVFADNTNLVQNFGFEQGSLDNWEKSSYHNDDGVTEFILDDKVSHTGSKSVCIINNSANDSRYKQNIKVKDNSYYKLSCWVKTENVGSEYKGANISVDGIIDTSNDIKGTSGWQCVEIYGSTKKNRTVLLLQLVLGDIATKTPGKHGLMM